MVARTFFLNCLWMASSASLIVTPFRFRAVTSRPKGKCKSIFLTGGLTSFSLRISLSSMVFGDLLSFLEGYVSQVKQGYKKGSDQPSSFLCLDGKGDFDLLLLYLLISYLVSEIGG